MKIQLLATDLDGTLLTSQKTVSERNLRTLSEAAARGLHIVVATGRSHRSIPQVVAELPFVEFVLALNGTQLIHHRSGEVLYERGFSFEQRQWLWEHVQRYAALPDLSFGGDLYMTSATMAKVHELQAEHPGRSRALFSTRFEAEDFEARLRDPQQISSKLNLLFTDPEARAAARTELEAIPWLQVATSHAMNIELNPRDGHKGTGLQAVAAHLGVDVRACMAIGDHDNDLPMIELAGVGVAMANGTPAVRAAADFVTLSNDEDGVAEAVRSVLLG